MKNEDKGAILFKNGSLSHQVSRDFYLRSTDIEWVPPICPVVHLILWRVNQVELDVAMY